MKIGVAGYPAPPDITPDERLAWMVGEAARLGLQIVGGDPRPVFGWDTRQYDLGYLRHVRALADSQGIEIEPYVRGPFDLVGPNAPEAIAAFRASIRAAKVLGGPYVRTGYGQLTITTSRFNRSIPVREHLRRLAKSLGEAAKIARDEGIIVAVENHCDFTGRELAEVIANVGSPAIGAALDTGNSLTVFCDPTDDLQALAPYALTTHLKDMKVVQNEERGRVPFVAVGCPLGQGQVDVSETIQVLVERSPRGREIPLIVEGGWAPVEPGSDRLESQRRLYRESIRYLRDLVERKHSLIDLEG